MDALARIGASRTDLASFVNLFFSFGINSHHFQEGGRGVLYHPFRVSFVSSTLLLYHSTLLKAML